MTWRRGRGPTRRATGARRGLLASLVLVLGLVAGALAACAGPPKVTASRHSTVPRPPPTVAPSTTAPTLPSATPTTVIDPVTPVPGWSAPLTALPPGGGFTTVSCLSSTYCIAAGGGNNQADVDATSGSGVADSWDGAAWANPSVYFPAPATGTPTAPVMPSISCTHGPLCVLVDGSDHVSSGDGTTWTTPAAFAAGPAVAAAPGDPGPGHAGSRRAAVACAGPSFCAAVDNTGRATVLQGGHWSALEPLATDAADNPRALYVAGPVGLACPASDACLAVIGPSAFTWDGSGWHAAAPWSAAAGAGESGTALSCPEVSLCWVASGQVAVEWNNGVWSAPQTVDPASGLDGVSCPTTTFCVAVDSSGSVVSWNGTAWSAPSRVLPRTTVYTGDPTSVSCPTARSCMVLDGDGDYTTFTAPSPSASTTTSTSQP